MHRNSKGHISELGRQHAALIDLQKAAEVAQVPLGTLYAWPKQGPFCRFQSRWGRLVRLGRDQSIRWLFAGVSRDEGVGHA